VSARMVVRGRSGLAAISLAAIALAPSLGAQKSTPIPSRPVLEAGADTNDARSYYGYGMKTVYDKPSEAVRGFYWASRINPGSAEVLYSLHCATLLAMSNEDMAGYYDFYAKNRKPQYLTLDTLILRVYSIDPFLYPNLEHTMLRRQIEAEIISQNPGINRAIMNDRIMSYLNNARFSAQVEYADGRMPQALADYAKDLTYRGWSKKTRALVTGDIHSIRARIFYVLGNLDSARTEMTAAVSAMRERDTTQRVILYRSKATYEQSLGMVFERQSQMDSARDAYGQALQEDLSYFPAHARLAQMALAKGDTTTALTELDLVVQLQPNDVVARYEYAVALVKVGHDAAAAAQLKNAIAVDPYFAAPHLLLARIADVEQYAQDAVGEYQQYVALTPRSDPNLPFVKGRLGALATAVSSAVAKP
jgi:tetratricopeptide (TPR) repeat protein